MSFASIADLPVVDDLNVPVDPTAYADQANPLPPLPGLYRFIVTKAEPARNKQNEIILQEGKFPIISVKTVKIVEGLGDGVERGLGIFQDIRTKPGVRKDKYGRDTAVSDFYDFLRAYDARESFDFEQGKQLLQRYLETNQSFVAELTWGALDFDYVKAEQEKAGGKDKLSKEVSNAIWSKARKNAKDFVVNGVRVSSIAGPSGNALEARPSIRRFYPSHEFNAATGEWVESKFTFGPFGKK